MIPGSERPFYDVSWLAVRGSIDADLLDALGLKDRREVSWDEGLAAVLADDTLARVFAAGVQGRDWSCLVGGWFGDTGDDARVADACRLASRLRGEAHAFTTQGRMDWYAWMAARDGVLVRRFVWDGGAIVDEGAPAREERWDDEDAFLEDTICALASAHAAGPDEYVGMTPRGVLVVPPAVTVA